MWIMAQQAGNELELVPADEFRAQVSMAQAAGCTDLVVFGSTYFKTPADTIAGTATLSGAISAIASSLGSPA